jgi:hypothetical protein
VKRKELFKETRARTWEKFLALLIGYKVKMAEVEEKSYLYPIEKVLHKEGKITRTIKISLRLEDRKKLLSRLEELVGEEDGIWVTPGIPMIFFIAMGFVFSLLFGNILFILVKYVFMRTF